MSFAAESLRWVKYEDVYYAALLAPDDEAPVPVESGHVFVYFLGSESGAVVPVEDTSPYDPQDTTRTSHPAAAAGVVVAQQLIAGAEAAAREKQEEEEGGSDGTATNVARRVKKEVSAKKKREEKSKKEKSRGKASSISEERERKKKAKALLRPKTDKQGRYGDSEDEEAENALLQLYPHNDKGAMKKKNDEVEEESEDDDEEEGTLGEDSRSRGDVSTQREEERNHWNDMARDLDITTPSRVSGEKGYNKNNTANKRHAGADLLTYDGESIVMPFLSELRYHYRQALKEATESDRLVNLQESELVRIVEAELMAWRGQMAHLQRLLSDVENKSQALSNTFPHTHDKSVESLLGEATVIRRRLDDVQSSFSLERIVQEHLRVRAMPLERRGRKPVGRGASGGGFSAFTDASLVFALDSQASSAAPRELPQQLAQRYREQRLHRERVLSSHQGLGKTGFSAPISGVMGKWRKSRELMVLDPRRESQPVLRRYSESIAKVERRALKCLSDMPESTKRMLPTYHSQQQLQQQPQQVRKNIYKFHDLCHEEPHGTSTFQRGNSVRNGENNNNGDDTRDVFQAPLISPLRTSFDPHATFALDIAEMVQEKALAEKLGMQSMQYSRSIMLPSEGSLWDRSEMYETERCRRTGRSCSRTGSVSRASSQASSMVADHNDDGNVNSTMSNRHATPGGQQQRPRNDWRASAKRAILEQLTLYLRGIRGKPSVLNREQFQSTAKKLLERAVRSESERRCLSMSLQVNNASASFTRDIEARLRKSVDNYVLRHFVNPNTSESRKRERSREARGTSVEQLATFQRSATQQRDEDDDTRSIMGAYRHANDSPVYDQL